MTNSSDAAGVLARELRLVLGKLKRRLREHANRGELSLSQLAALATLEREGPATVTTLARAEGVRPQSMSATVTGLQEAGLVAGAADPADGRQVLLSLTGTARAWLDANRAAREDWLSGALRAHLSPEEQRELGGAVALLRKIVD